MGLAAGFAFTSPVLSTVPNVASGVCASATGTLKSSIARDEEEVAGGCREQRGLQRHARRAGHRELLHEAAVGLVEVGDLDAGAVVVGDEELAECALGRGVGERDARAVLARDGADRAEDVRVIADVGPARVADRGAVGEAADVHDAVGGPVCDALVGAAARRQSTS